MNVADVLYDLVAKTTYPGDQNDATFARLDAIQAIQAWENGASLPDAEPVERPDYALAPQAVAPAGFDYDALAAAMLRAQAKAEAAPAAADPAPVPPVSAAPATEPVSPSVTVDPVTGATVPAA